MKIGPLFFLLFFTLAHFLLSAQSIKDTRSFVLANNEIAFTDSFSLNSNVATTNFLKSNTLEITHIQNYFVQELSTSTLQYNYGKFKNQLFRFGLNYSGNANFNLTIFSLAYARKINEKFNLGLVFTDERYQYAENRYQNLNNLFPSISLFAKVTSKIDLAFLINNPFRTKIANDLFLPGKLIGSLAYSANKSTKIGISFEQKNGQEIIISSGVEYQFTKTFVIRSAYVSQLSKLSFGTRIFYQKMFFDIGFSNQLLLGNSASFSLLVPLTK